MIINVNRLLERARFYWIGTIPQANNLITTNSINWSRVKISRIRALIKFRLISYFGNKFHPTRPNVLLELSVGRTSYLEMEQIGRYDEGMRYQEEGGIT